MSEELDTAQRYRQRAEELRVISEQFRFTREHDIICKIAISYDRMADMLETLDRRSKGEA